MPSDKITVREAVSYGIIQVNRPYKIIMITTGILGAVLILFGFPRWTFILIPLGLLLPFIYGPWSATKWQIWAYEHVRDIHQLQRSAELAGVLDRGSHERVSWIATVQQKEKLVALQRRFLDDYSF